MMMTEKKNVQCTWQERVIDLLDFLKQEGLSPDLLDGIREFNAQYPTPPELQNRIPQPRYHYYGKDVWEAAVAAILCGENLLLAVLFGDELLPVVTKARGQTIDGLALVTEAVDMGAAVVDALFIFFGKRDLRAKARDTDEVVDGGGAAKRNSIHIGSYLLKCGGSLSYRELSVL